jgi:hypothetical protein
MWRLHSGRNNVWPGSLAMLVLIGCGSSVPSDETARKIVEASFQSLPELNVNMSDFRKLKVDSKEFEGQKIYRYWFLSATEVPDGMAMRTVGSGQLENDLDSNWTPGF